ncbi:MAG: MarR family transcriptional regulator [Pseudomonadota bacterium]
MTKKKVQPEKKQFIEEVGILFDEFGLPRMAGRILGWLLVCEPLYQSASELGDVVGASKGSISTMTRMMVQRGLVERMGIPGKRSAYYRMKSGAHGLFLKSHLVLAKAFREITDRGLAIMAQEPASLQERLKEMRDFHVFFEREMPALIERYEKEHRA